MFSLPSSFIYLFILLGLFLAVVWIVNLWVRYKTWHDESYVVQQIYTKQRLFFLYVKCWVVVVAVFTMFYWVEMDIWLVMLLFLLAALAMVGIIYGEDLEEYRLLQSQSENMMLRSQLNPHFLYNTLNNIDALIWLDQSKASDAVNNLSGLMRYITYSAKQEVVQIGEEVDNLRLLVELQRLRVSVPDALSFQTDIDNPRMTIAPLLLLPLLENCFKHCGDLNEPRAIDISIAVKHGWLDFRSSNNLPKEHENEASTPATPQKPARRRGIGMIILRRRLSLLYGNRYAFEYGQKGDRYETHLQVKL